VEISGAKNAAVAIIPAALMVNGVVVLENLPRISDVDVDIDPVTRDGCLLVNIRYTVAATNIRDNLVFPFYLNAAREETSL
jgi:UDP-N-acetylglucosamine enolpyruvyl transferase